MEVLLLAVEDGTAFEARDDPERAPAYWAGWQGYLRALEDAGVLRAANGLQGPRTAVTVRAGRAGGAAGTDDAGHVQDGPYADTKEQLGGYFLLEVRDLEEAVAWAARCPAARDGGACEVRPVLPMRDG